MRNGKQVTTVTHNKVIKIHVCPLIYKHKMNTNWTNRSNVFWVFLVPSIHCKQNCKKNNRHGELKTRPRPLRVSQEVIRRTKPIGWSFTVSLNAKLDYRGNSTVVRRLVLLLTQVLCLLLGLSTLLLFGLRLGLWFGLLVSLSICLQFGLLFHLLVGL